jgi:hypothetical protein
LVADSFASPLPLLASVVEEAGGGATGACRAMTAAVNPIVDIRTIADAFVKLNIFTILPPIVGLLR